MNTKELRSWVHTQVESWRTALGSSAPPTFYENGEVPDEKTIGPIWLDVSLSFMGTKQVTVGVRPRGRDAGTIKLMLYYRDGEGTAALDELVDSLREHFRANRRFGSVRLGFPEPSSAPAFKGWHKAGLMVPLKNDLE